MIYAATVNVGGRTVATYRGDLGTVRRKSLAKLRQIVGRRVSKPFVFLWSGRQASNWGDRMEVQDLSGSVGWVEGIQTAIRLA